MILMLDVFGVVYQSRGLNKPLLEMAREIKSQGYEVYLASNTSERQLKHFMDDLRVRKYVTGAFCSGAIGHSKPDKRFYAHITQSLGKMPAEFLFFDDSVPNVKGAHDHGWDAYVYEDLSKTKALIESFFHTTIKAA